MRNVLRALPVNRRRQRPRSLLVPALVLAAAGCVSADPPAGLGDLDERFRGLLRARLGEPASLDQEQLLALADAAAQAVYGSDPARLKAAARNELATLPPLPPELSRCVPDGGSPTLQGAVSVPVPAESLWTRPWSPTQVAARALALHRSRTLNPQQMSVDALLAGIAPPRTYRVDGDWHSPVLAIESLRDCYRIRLRVDEPSGSYIGATLERIPLSEGRN